MDWDWGGGGNRPIHQVRPLGCVRVLPTAAAGAALEKKEDWAGLDWTAKYQLGKVAAQEAGEPREQQQQMHSNVQCSNKRATNNNLKRRRPWGGGFLLKRNEDLGGTGGSKKIDGWAEITCTFRLLRSITGCGPSAPLFGVLLWLVELTALRGWQCKAEGLRLAGCGNSPRKRLLECSAR